MLKRLLAAALSLALVATAAIALNVDPNKTFPARQNTTQQVNYFRVTINFNDPGIASGVKFGKLPAAAFVNSAACEVVTAFNAATTNVLTLGTTSTANEIMAAADLDETATGTTVVTRGLGRSLTSSADTDLYAKYTQTGTAATAGQAICVITFIPNNDL